MSTSTPLQAQRGSNGSAVQAALIERRVLFDYIAASFPMIASSLLPARDRALTLWRKHPRELLALGAMAFAALAVGGAAWSIPNTEEIAAARAEQTAPAPPPLLVRDLAPADAVALNSNI